MTTKCDEIERDFTPWLDGSKSVGEKVTFRGNGNEVNPFEARLNANLQSLDNKEAVEELAHLLIIGRSVDDAVRCVGVSNLGGERDLMLVEWDRRSEIIYSKINKLMDALFECC